MKQITLFRYGFRPFFLAAGTAAVLLIPWWAASFALGLPLGTNWPPSLWHGHEMLFGLIGAAIAGFLLTAVPSWTGQRGFAGLPLATLAGVWLLGRLAVATSAWLPLPFVAGVDLAFFPGLALLVLPPLLRARNRNTPLLLVLGALFATNATFYWGLGRADPALARHSLLIGIDIVILLVTIIGGRIVPAFTSSALKQRGAEEPLHTWPGVTQLAIASMLVLVLIDVLLPESPSAGLAATLASIVQAVRLAQWRALRTLKLPIVWVLHLAYAWLPVGLALKALALLGGFAFAAFWLHALTVGATVTMIFAVMTRASLGHTGRPLVVSPAVAVAYLLLTAAAVIRAFGPDMPDVPYAVVILLAAAFWTAAFAIFLWIYAPILLSPRVDGKPG